MSEQIVSLENFSAPYDLKDLDPNIDAGRIKDVQGATLEGAVLTSCTPGTVVSYSYKTGLQIGSTDLLLSSSRWAPWIWLYPPATENQRPPTSTK